MCDQLKALGKYLFAGFLFSCALASESEKPDLDAARLVEQDGQQTLQTGLWKYQKGDVSLDLIGVVHLADAGYYQELNTLFESYDTVFFEMIADKPALKALRTNPNTTTKSEKGDLSELNKMYTLYQAMMDLSLQTEKIDYSKENLLHADMTETQFLQAQRDAGETVGSFLMSSNIDISKIDQGIAMRAMMTGDSTLLKTELIGLLSTADNSFEDDGASSIILGARNDTCLSITNEHLTQNPNLKKVAIFYGAAHLPDFHQKLTAQDWILKEQNWLPAWKITSNLNKKE